MAAYQSAVTGYQLLTVMHHWVHPIRGDEMRALRTPRRDYPKDASACPAGSHSGDAGCLR
jgi:hypothetical protein